NVGIGSTSPTAALSIFQTPSNRNLNNFAFSIGSSTAAFATTTLFSVDTQGNVVITGSTLHLASTTLQNFTGLNSTTTNATSSTLTVSGSTNLGATSGNVDIGVMGTVLGLPFQVHTAGSASQVLFQSSTNGTPADTYTYGFVSNPTTGDIVSIRNSLGTSPTGSLLNLDTASAGAGFALITAKSVGVNKFVVGADGSMLVTGSTTLQNFT